MSVESRASLVGGLLIGGFISWFLTKRSFLEREQALLREREELDAPEPAEPEPSSPRPEMAELAITSRMLARSWSARKKKKIPAELGVRVSSKLAALTAPSTSKYVLAMVGLPARGKSYIVKMMMRYLRWSGVTVEIFNVGNYRRKMNMSEVTADYFDNNEDATKQRESLALQVQEDMYKWLHSQQDLSVAFFDATNTTRERRQKIMDRAKTEKDVHLLFVESICDDPKILERNYKSKMANGDYKNRDREEAMADFTARVKKYEEVYEELEDDEGQGKIAFIKVYNVGLKVVTRKCAGYVPSQVAFHLMNVHISPRKIWLSRHSESPDQIRGFLGGTSGEITDLGAKYSKELSIYIREQLALLKKEKTASDKNYKGDQLVVMLGTHPVHLSTVEVLKKDCEHMEEVTFMHNSILNELRAGEFEKMTHAEIKRKFPEIWEEKMSNKLHFRYPGNGGESYVDLIQRIKPVIVELERQRKSVLVVSHLAVQRCLRAYFSGVPMDKIPYLDMPIHEITELNVEPQGTKISTKKLSESSLDFCATPRMSRTESMFLSDSRTHSSKSPSSKTNSGRYSAKNGF